LFCFGKIKSLAQILPDFDRQKEFLIFYQVCPNYRFLNLPGFFEEKDGQLTFVQLENKVFKIN
jgi:hypothetical protein